jgi:uncharacterized membrane protein
MKLLRLAFNRQLAMPILGVTFASGVSVALVIARIFWTGKLQYAFLVWNLFLAWVPLALSLLACDTYRSSSARNWRFVALATSWLLFFPNAPYIFTDLIHLTTHYYSHFWVDLVLVLSCALTGLVLGFLSLHQMHFIVHRLSGRAASWLFIATVTFLSSFGICLGRFLRFNSWDILFKPLKLATGITNFASGFADAPHSFAFPVLFATFLFIAYVMLYALTHLQPSPDLYPAPATIRET